MSISSVRIAGPHSRARGTPVSEPRLRVAVLGSTGGWHAERLERALTARGHECGFAPVTRMVGRIDGGFAVRGREVALDACDVVLVRGDPARLARAGRLPRRRAARAGRRRRARGQRRARDRAHGRQVPRLGAAGRRRRSRRRGPSPASAPSDALAAFAELGADVIVKPLFGSMGLRAWRGSRTADVAQRVFRALEIERAVYYLQETLPHDGVDVRALVVGERVVARDRARRRRAGGRTSRAARAPRADRARRRSARALCVRAAAALGADYAGVDLLRAADGRDYVLEVNGIPGWHGRRARHRGRRGGGARRAPGASS